MRIIIDARMYGGAGIGRYIRNLVLNLQKIDKKNEYFIIHSREDYNRLVYHNNFTSILADVKWYGVLEQIRLPKILNQLKPDLVHFPHFNIPLLYQGKFVVTIHDLIHQQFQMRRVTTLNPLIYKIKQLGYRQVFKKAVSGSEKILVPSKYVKDLLIKKWNVNTEKILVTPEGVDDNLLTIAKKLNHIKTKLVLAKFNIESPFIFYVGNAHPHKNVEGLIKTFIKLKVKYKELKLVLAGHDHYFWQRIKQSLATSLLKKDIIFTGYITDEELVALYKNARCFVMPSFQEGFGIPLLEAMAVGCPVISSDRGSLPEVGGNACLYFDPLDIDDFQSKLEKILSDEKIRQDLIKKGQQRVKLFSWKKLAEQTLEVYSQCK